jgi:glycosyltransferase involved in cell wall biosynthesis
MKVLLFPWDINTMSSGNFKYVSFLFSHGPECVDYYLPLFCRKKFGKGHYFDKLNFRCLYNVRKEYLAMTHPSINWLGSLFKYSGLKLFPYFRSTDYPEIMHVSKDNDFDLIHCDGNVVFTKIPWVYSADIIDMKRSCGHEWKVLVKSLKQDSCKAIILRSNTAKNYFLEQLKERDKFLLKHKLQFIPCGLETPKLKKKSNKKVKVLFVASDFERKGGDLAARIFDEISDDVNAELVIAGSKPKNDDSLKIIQNNKNIKHLGFVSNRKIKEIMSSSDIFFFPTLEEPFGIVVTEALSYGLPIIASNTFAMPEIVGKAGFAIDLKKEDEIKKKLVLLINNTNFRKKLSDIARKKAETEYSFSSINNKLEKVYKHILS